MGALSVDWVELQTALLMLPSLSSPASRCFARRDAELLIGIRYKEEDTWETHSGGSRAQSF